jgi:hypothetical protein
MKMLGIGVIGLIIGAALAAVVLVVLDDDDPANAPSVSADSPPPCARLIPDAAVTSLVWAAPPAAQEHVGRCERRDDAAGEVTVGTRALASLDDDRAKAAKDEYDAQCSALEGPDGSSAVERPPSWLTDDHDACAQLPDGGEGVAQVFVLADEDVVQIRVVARKQVDDAHFHDALNALVDAAVAAY